MGLCASSSAPAAATAAAPAATGADGLDVSVSQIKIGTCTLFAASRQSGWGKSPGSRMSLATHQH